MCLQQVTPVFVKIVCFASLKIGFTDFKTFSEVLEEALLSLHFNVVLFLSCFFKL